MGVMKQVMSNQAFRTSPLGMGAGPKPFGGVQFTPTPTIQPLQQADPRMQSDPRGQQMQDWRALRPDVAGLDGMARRSAIDSWKDLRPGGGGGGNGIPGLPRAPGAGGGGIMNSIMQAFNGGAGGGMDMTKLLSMLTMGG